MSEVALLVTDGGPHPADKWAALSGSKIADLIQIDEQSHTDEAAVARKAKPRFALDVADALEGVFAASAVAERKRCESSKVSRSDPFYVDDYLKEASGAIVDTAASTPFAKHFSLSEVQTAVHIILQQYFIDAANIERSWALDAKGL